jgi:hypothetical protein
MVLWSRLKVDTGPSESTQVSLLLPPFCMVRMRVLSIPATRASPPGSTL